MAPKAPIVPVPLPAPRTGLIVAAPSIEDPDLRWTGGFTWSPEGGAHSGAAAVPCLGNTDALAGADPLATTEHTPIYVWAGEDCSVIGFRSRDWQARVQRALAAEQSYQIARELWTGALSTADTLGNRALASTAANNVFYDAALADGFACMDGLLTSCLRNRQGMIHVMPGLLTALVAGDLVYRDGGTWLSPNGHIIVADAGYNGNGPQGEYATSDQWIYGTDMIRLRLGPVELLPRNLEDPNEIAAVMDRDTNDLTVWAGRFIGVEWDGACHLAGEVTTDRCVDAATGS